MTHIVNGLSFTNDNPPKENIINLYDSYTFDEWLEHRNDEAYRKDWVNRYARKQQERRENELAERELMEKIDLLIEIEIEKAVEKAFKEAFER